jgi:hypothetical protein
MDYLLKEKKMTEMAAKHADEKISRYEDIRLEFEVWIQNGEYKTENPLTIENYSAMDIFKLAPFLDGLGVFNFMVTLREVPERAKKYIDSGFARK